MNQETKTCQNCKKEFTIEPEDFEFYKKINVPAPTFCPKCRLIRRLAWRDGRTMFKITCALCEKETFSMYASDTEYTVYCNECWWSDKWDPLSYGQDYDFDQSFFEQSHELFKKVPRPATNRKNSPTSPYCNNVTGCKNCYLVFGGYYSEDCMYSEPIMSRTSFDSDLLFNGDHAYETVSCTGVFRTSFSFYAEECLDSAFLFDCKGCNDCFGSVNLRNKKYYIFNKPYPKDTYKEKIKEWDLGSYKELQQARDAFKKHYYSIPRRFAIVSNVENVTGNDIIYARNCHECFGVANGIENCKYIFFGGLLLKDSYDSTAVGDNGQLLYETNGSAGAENVYFSKTASQCHNVQYCDQVTNCSDLFGCANLRNKNHCILNKKYTKDEYFALKERIIKQMSDMPYINEKGIEYRYGEGFPIEMAPLPYNNAWVQIFFPLTQEQARNNGYTWKDQSKTKHRITMTADRLPDHVNDTPDDITKEIIECEHQGKCNDACTTAFRILPDELQFYRSMKVALPRMCPNCRYVRRFRWTNVPGLSHRKCMCAGSQSDEPRIDGQKQYSNESSHFHSTDHCPNEFETAYLDDRKEIVYCQQCYNQEFI